MKQLSSPSFKTYEHGSENLVSDTTMGLRLASKPGHVVTSYFELLEKIANISYYNSNFKLLFRGQNKDYRIGITGQHGGRGILYPSILRPNSQVEREKLLDDRFQALREAERNLAKVLPVSDIINLRVVRWAILQHYEVCDTPLLDVTSSLQCALSFAFGSRKRSDSYIFVLAVPHLTGPISVSTESMTQVIDLAHICPPEALRPHFQSGILLGDYPEYSERSQTHDKIGFIDNDFSCRLLAKFHLKDIDNWEQEGFTPTPINILFPDSKDRWFASIQKIRMEAMK